MKYKNWLRNSLGSTKQDNYSWNNNYKIGIVKKVSSELALNS